MAQSRTIGNTMGAVVYGNEPYNNLRQNLETVRQSELMQQQQQQLQAQKLAESYRDNALKVQSGKLWSNEIAQLAQQHYNRGLGYRRSGRDIYNQLDPDHESYMTERAKLQSLMDYAKGVETDVIKQLEAYRGAVPGTYDPRSVNELNEFISGTSAMDAYTAGRQAPHLRKQFDPMSPLKGVNAIINETQVVDGNVRRKTVDVDRGATERLVLNRYMNDPAGAEYLNQITGGIPAREMASIPGTMQENIAAIREEYEGNPILRQQMAEDLGISSVDSPEFQQAATMIAMERLNAKNRYNQFLDRAIGSLGVTRALGVTETPDTTAESMRLRREQLALSRQREARLSAEAGKSTSRDITFVGKENIPVGSTGQGNSGKTPVRNAVNFYNTTVSVTGGDAYNMNSRRPYPDVPSISGKIVKLGEYPFDTTTGELLDESQVTDNPNVEYRKMAQIDSDGVNVLVPASKVPSTLPKEKQAMVTEFLDAGTTQPQQSEAPKKTATKAQIQALVGQPGYEGYSEKELIEYYRSQGYTIN